MKYIKVMIKSCEQKISHNFRKISLLLVSPVDVKMIAKQGEEDSQ